MKIGSIYIVLYFLVTVVVLSLSPIVLADTFQSPRYTIESGSFDFQPELDKDAGNYDLSSSFGADSQKKFETKGYVAVIREDADSSGKPYIRLQVPSSQLIFYSADVRDEDVQKSTIKLMGRGLSRFIVALKQEEQFKNSFGAIIDSTRCDYDSTPCTPLSAQTWIKAYGFGYRTDSPTVEDFMNPKAFRPFFIGSSTGKSSVLFNGELDKDGRSIGLEFKLRPQPQTQTGLYKSTIIITATADY